MRHFLSGLALAWGVFAGAGAWAADDRWCSGVSDSADTADLRIARVAGKDKRVHFVSNPGDTASTQACPDLSEACRRRGFLVPGNAVLVEAVRGPLACVSYVSGRAVETGGWVPLASLDMNAPKAEPAPADWAGEWKRVEASITIKASGNTIEADGNATYGTGNPERVRNGAVNTGEFGGKAVVKGITAAFGEGYTGEKDPDDKASACQVRVRLFSPYLVVDDNRNCGGMNVSFSGIYVRVRR